MQGTIVATSVGPGNSSANNSSCVGTVLEQESFGNEGRVVIGSVFFTLFGGTSSIGDLELAPTSFLTFFFASDGALHFFDLFSSESTSS